MKTATVPAQVTTIEDRIAGNFTVSQLLILMLGFGLATIVYFFVAPRYHFNPVKAAVMLATVLCIVPLSLRIGDRILADWLVVLIRFWLRPRRYVFTKNDPSTRSLPPSKNMTTAITQIATSKPVSSAIETVSVPDKIRFDELLTSPSLAVRFVVAKKGGIDVTLAPLKR
jgi:hypothetical protein